MVTLIKTRLQIKTTIHQFRRPPPPPLLNQITHSQTKLATLPAMVSPQVVAVMAVVEEEERVVVVAVVIMVQDNLIIQIYLRPFHP